jgi:transcriptional regulator with PAS, ATPase and Fis domain
MLNPLRNSTVLLSQADPNRLDAVAKIIASTGARAVIIKNACNVQSSPRCSVAVISLGTSPESTASLNIVGPLKANGFKIIAYGPNLFSWPIANRCRALLAGASILFDCLSPTFGSDLSQALIKILTTESQEYFEEARLRGQMKSLGIVGQSSRMIAVFRWLVRVSALSDFPVLISGETGTGKELIANALHQLDPKRRAGPFVVTNCSAISPGLAESELFGHRRGAFTGADTDRKGLFRSAHRGILFLDEIGELSESLQAKLLRVLQEKRVLGVGFDHEVPIDVRIVAATNRNLDQMVKNGRFREDLYHRLNGLSLNVPPLRERSEDLQPLIEHFVGKYSAVTNNPIRSVNLDFVEGLMQIDLPGNARQLENIVRSAMLNKGDDSPLGLSDLAPALWQEISADSINDQNGGIVQTRQMIEADTIRDLHSYFQHILDENSWNLPRSLEYCEKIFLQCVLHSARGNQSQAARLIGITPRSVYNKLQKYKLHPSS